MAGGFGSANDDILQNIFNRLPAISFASAACVNKNWNSACGRILSKPKLASALSLNPSLHLALREVLDKVLSEPIRPHFVLAFIGLDFCLEETHQVISEVFSPGIPVITNATSGIMGVDALTHELREVKWDYADDDETIIEDSDMANSTNKGIVLAVGYVPGLKVDVIPLLRPSKGPFSMVDKFLSEVRDFTIAASGYAAPVGIILFGDEKVDLKRVLSDMDYVMPDETVIVGDASACFLSKNKDNTLSVLGSVFSFDAVALVFAKDRNKPAGTGETRLRITMSTGIMPFGPRLKAASVVLQGSECTWLTAKIDGHRDILDGSRILGDISDMMEDENPDLYVGVIQKRALPGSPESSKEAKSLTYYEVLGGDRECFIVDGIGIRPGDSFLLYHSDFETASTSSDIACENLETFKAGTRGGNRHHMETGNSSHKKEEVFGGLIFSCHCRGESYFGEPNVESLPFSKNFPDIPIAGAFCSGEIGRGLRLVSEDEDEDDHNNNNNDEDEDEEIVPCRCCQHVYSTIYLVMSYVPED